MNELQIFDHEKFGQVRTILRDGEVWFVAMDVAEILEYSDAYEMTKRLKDSEKMKLATGEMPVTQSALARELTLISEPGLYRAIFGSKKKEAEEFQTWVFHTVLPQIRKTGQYLSPEKQAQEEHPLMVMTRRYLEVQAEQDRQREEQVRQAIEIGKHRVALEFQRKEIERQRLQLEQERKQRRQQERMLQDISAKATALLEGDGYFTIAGYARKMNIPMDERTAQRLGYICRKRSGIAGLPISKYPHQKYGHVNAYSERVLDEVFKEWMEE